MDHASSFFTKIPLMYRKNSILESVRKNPLAVDKNRELEPALLTLPHRHGPSLVEKQGKLNK